MGVYPRGKVIRDYIPRKVTERGEILVFKNAPEGERSVWLKRKLLEEAYEVGAEERYDKLGEELADLLTVMDQLAREYHITWEDIIETANNKNADLGAFNDVLIMFRIETPMR